MAITQALCSTFKTELASGLHDFTADTFKIALYSSTANMGAFTTVYATDDEVTGTGYTAGGNTLTVSGPTLSGSTAIISFANTNWPASTFTARGALIYNSTNSNAAVMVLDFGSDRTVADASFTIAFPTADASNAILRIT